MCARSSSQQLARLTVLWHVIAHFPAWCQVSKETLCRSSGGERCNRLLGNLDPDMLSFQSALLQVVDLHQQCDPSAWASAAASPWQFLSMFSDAHTSVHAVPVPLQRCLLQAVCTAQRLQVPCPENQAHSTSWSASHLAPVADLLARTQDEAAADLCVETIHATVVALRLHSGPDELVRPVN